MADISCGMKTIKLLLVIFNFIFTIVGIAVLGTGIAVLVFFEKFVAVTGTNVLITPIAVVVVGVIILVVALFGFFGALSENACMVMTYAAFLGVLLIAQFACAVAAFILRNKVEEILKKDLNEKMSLYYNTTTEKNSVVHKAIDLIQKEFKCCGVTSSADWKAWQQPVPKSCCVTKDCDTSQAANINSKGCVDAVKQQGKEKILLVGGVALLLCAIELLCIAFGCSLAKALNKAYEPV